MLGKVSCLLQQVIGALHGLVLALKQHDVLAVSLLHTPHEEYHYHAYNNTKGEKIHLRPCLQKLDFLLQFSYGVGSVSH